MWNKRNSEDYKDEKKHQKIVSNKHFIHDIEMLHPLSLQYKKYWKEIKRRCMEGYWYDGKWMPGNLYFYVNLSKIKLNQDQFSTTKVVARPFLRDLEWEKAYVFAEARGFSGFLEDDEYTCYTGAYNFDKLDPEDQELILFEAPKEAKKGNGMKKFIPARQYLRTIHSKNLGKPLYQNQASNVIDMESRGGGKSYWGAGGMIIPTYLTDGMYDYDKYLANLAAGIPMATEIIVGAIDAKYSNDLLSKVDLAFENLVGRQVIRGEIYDCPISKITTGAWNSGAKKKVNLYEEKVGNNWVTRGSGTTIHHRNFKDNPLAGNGTRLSLGILEEVGFMSNLEDSLNNMKDTTYDGTRKFGTIYMFGTGGENDPEAVEQVKRVFNNPAAYDCLCFDDIWEETGDIGFFVPYEMTLNQYKNEEGITDLTKASKFVDNKRSKLVQGKSKKALNSEMMNNPRVPSEIFLSEGANIFPIAEIKEQINWLKGHQTDALIRGQYGHFKVVSDGAGNEVVGWEPDLTNSLKPCTYGMKNTDDTTGCWVIWEHPKLKGKEIPYGLYIAGTDPYDQDKAPNSVSLGSTFIYKTFTTEEGETVEWPVAEYTARPDTARDHHEQVRLGMLYFNARDLYENERNTLKMHFEHKNSLYLLAKTPTILKATEGSKVDRTYGIHMTDTIKEEIEIFARDWMKTSIGDGKLNINKIYSIPLLEELLAYNKKGNFDRVIAFLLVILHRLQNHRVKVQDVKEAKQIDDFIARFNRGAFYN